MINKKTLSEIASIVIILIGIIFLYQPAGAIHTWALPILLVGVISWSIISPRKQFVERIAIGMIAFGIISLCQPKFMVLYKTGFHILLSGTVGFIVVGHRPSKVQQSSTD